MSSIRPLVTITILVVVGVFLYTKINEGPAGPSSLAGDGSAPDIPPLSTTGPVAGSEELAPAAPRVGGATTETLAPQWAGGVSNTSGGPVPALPPAINVPAPIDAPEVADKDDPSLPDVPAIPELPPLDPSSENALSSAAPLTKPQIELPADVPTARYPDAPPAADSSQSRSASGVGSSAASIADFAAVATMDAPAPELPAPGVSGDGGAGRDNSILTDDATDSFAAAWPAIQAALDREELAQAHQLLSQWYGNPALSPAEAEQVETLLGQLAGSVVYSADHRLEPPYVVRAGDSLETIADKYEVPWQLLAKINSIPAADLIQPGQELKVVHGPFTAIIELGKNQLTLALEGRYAGRFPITAEPGAENHEGLWVLEQKLTQPATGAVSRVLVLRSGSPLAVGEAISITGGSTPPTGPTAVAPPAIRLSAQDAEELADILSVGSRVVIRR